MFTLVAFSESQDEAGAYTNIAAVADQHVGVSGDIIYTPELNNIIGVVACTGATVPGNPYVDAPSLRRACLLDIEPFYALTIPLTSNLCNNIPLSPLSLAVSEGIKIYSNANPSAAEYHTAGILLADKAITPASGQIFTLRATASITGSNGAWANGAMTFSQTLPVGRYAVVGAVCAAANGVFFRLVFSGYSWRPGFVVNNLVTNNQALCQRYGGLGVWGEFHSITPPTLDILVIDTCTSQVVYLDLIKLG